MNARMARRFLAAGTAAAASCVSIAVLQAATAVAAPSAASFAPSAASTDWPSVNFNNANTSYDRFETVLSAATVSTLHPVKQGSFVDDAGNSPILVSGGRIFDTCAPSGGNSLGICAWAESDLRALWHTSIPGGDPGETNMSAADGRLFVHADGFPYLAFEPGVRRASVAGHRPGSTIVELRATPGDH